jgi:hypothetical protein
VCVRVGLIHIVMNDAHVAEACNFGWFRLSTSWYDLLRYLWNFIVLLLRLLTPAADLIGFTPLPR